MEMLTACRVQIRELKLRRAGISARARIASELRKMDDQVCTHVLVCSKDLRE